MTPNDNLAASLLFRVAEDTLHLAGPFPGMMGRNERFSRRSRLAMPEQLSDAILLERFVSSREEAAFVALVQRHGPLVEGICRRVLRNDHDVEDVSQATFLILARKAAGIPWRESVGGWLCSVARRLALGTRSDLARQHRRETSFDALPRRGTVADPSKTRMLAEEYHPIADPFDEVDRRDLRRLLDDELLRLPEKYREPVVLCDLEGRTHEEAARQLGCPAGSMSRRLERARALLRKRLVLRGLSLTICMMACALLVAGAWSIAHRADRTSASIRQAMTPLKPLFDGAADVQGFVARVDRDRLGSPDRGPVIDLARQSARIAERIEGHDPGRNRDDWREYVIEMRTSALLLAQVTEQNDASGMLFAARRLDTSCQKCHKAFCQ
jgi:RNA polymerase sigma-70 factor (ECF subfamily)